MASIYVLIDPVTEEIRYVGWTIRTLAERLKSHLRERCDCHRKWWVKSLLRRGLKPRIQLLHTVSEKQWSEAERYWIKFFRSMGCPLTNGTDGGEGMLGHRQSAETRERLRLATKRQFESPHARAEVSKIHKGKEISPEHRQRVGVATKRRWEEWRASGAKASDETRAKISAARRGKPLSEEHRAAVGAAQRGVPKTLEHRAKLSSAAKARVERQRHERG